MTNSTSLNELRKWISIINTFSGTRNNEPSVALVGLKGDLEHLRAVRLDAHTRFAQEHNFALSFLSSAKSGESVSLFEINFIFFPSNTIRAHDVPKFVQFFPHRLCAVSIR